MRDTLPCLFLWVDCRNASLLLVPCWTELPAACSSHWFCCSSIDSCWHGKSSVFMGLSANTSWEWKTNPCLVGDSACVTSIYGAKGMTGEVNAQSSQYALYPGNSLQWFEGAEIVSLLTLGLLDVSILARLPVNGSYSKQHQNQSDKPDTDETKD